MFEWVFYQGIWFGAALMLALFSGGVYYYTEITGFLVASIVGGAVAVFQYISYQNFLQELKMAFEASKYQKSESDEGESE